MLQNGVGCGKFSVISVTAKAELYMCGTLRFELNVELILRDLFACVTLSQFPHFESYLPSMSTLRLFAFLVLLPLASLLYGYVWADW